MMRLVHAVCKQYILCLFFLIFDRQTIFLQYFDTVGWVIIIIIIGSIPWAGRSCPHEFLPGSAVLWPAPSGM